MQINFFGGYPKSDFTPRFCENQRCLSMSPKVKNVNNRLFDLPYIIFRKPIIWHLRKRKNGKTKTAFFTGLMRGKA